MGVCVCVCVCVCLIVCDRDISTMRQSGPDLGCGAIQKKNITIIYVVNNMICYFIIAIYCRIYHLEKHLRPENLTFTQREKL